MAIRVICPGCMTRFEVSDKFAGKKGPCPKCGHIIEIPKENLVVHAPDDITRAGKKGYKGNAESLRPILQRRFIFSIKQVVLSLLGVVLVLFLTAAVGSMTDGLVKNVIGGVSACLIGFPLIAFGYMLLRDDDDLEILLGHELYRRSFWVSLAFGVTWLALEWLVQLLAPGYFFLIYLIPLAIFGTFAVVMVFDTDFAKGITLYLFFAICIVVLRGILFAPDGWIWSQAPTRIRAVTPAAVQTEGKPDGKTPVETDTEKPQPNTPAAPKKEQPVKKKLSREAPDASKKLRN